MADEVIPNHQARSDTEPAVDLQNPLPTQRPKLKVN
jgi:hypothetical protein